jgi:hypothetical protein
MGEAIQKLKSMGAIKNSVPNDEILGCDAEYYKKYELWFILSTCWVLSSLVENLVTLQSTLLAKMAANASSP